MILETLEMSTLSGYLLRAYFPPFFLTLGTFTLVLLMNYFLRLFHLAMGKGISLLWIFKCFALLLPHFFSLAVPMAFLVALLLSLGQLSEDGEILALRAAGFSFGEVLRPFLILALVLGGLLIYINHVASPQGFHAFKDAYSSAAERVARVDLEPRTSVSLGDWKLYAQEITRETGRLRGVYLVRFKGVKQTFKIRAPEGLLRIRKGKGVDLELYRGQFQLPNPDPARLTLAQFEIYRVFVPFFKNAGLHRDPDVPEMQSLRLVERLREEGLPPLHQREYRTELAVRSAGALSPFVFFWIGCPLGIRLEKKSRAAGFALSLGILFVYYGLLALGLSLGRRFVTFSSWAPWIPNLVLLAAGFLLSRRHLKG